MAEAIYIAGFYICFVWAIKQHLAIRVLRRDMNAADERISRYRMAVDAIDKWCGHESAEARLIAAFIGASGEGRSMNGGTPIKDEVCDVSGTRDQLRRLKLGAQADTNVEPYAVLFREIGETSFFDHRPVRPGTEQHLAAMRNPELDYVELFIAAPGAHTGSRDDSTLLDAMERQRIAVVPEYEGPWDAEIYNDEGQPNHHGTGSTPREAIRAAIATQTAAQGEQQ